MTDIPTFTWQPDTPDFRDTPYTHTNDIQPDHVDLRSKMPPVFSQGKLGSCTANALAGQLGFLHPGSANFSRLFIYYGERSIEGTLGRDAGAQLRSGIKFLSSAGCCLESEWPYNTARLNLQPLNETYAAALPNKILSYSRLTTLDDMLDCLAAGFPFVFGMSIYSAFVGDLISRTGVLNMPTANERLLGGHAVEAVGYDIQNQRFIIRNSWGVKWGQAGHFTIPFDYVSNRGLSDDFWTIRK